MILDRNRASVPRGSTLSRNILANLGRKHGKTTLEPACAQLVDTTTEALADAPVSEYRRRNSRPGPVAHRTPRTAWRR